MNNALRPTLPKCLICEDISLGSEAFEGEKGGDAFSDVGEKDPQLDVSS